MDYICSCQFENMVIKFLILSDHNSAFSHGSITSHNDYMHQKLKTTFTKYLFTPAYASWVSESSAGDSWFKILVAPMF